MLPVILYYNYKFLERVNKKFVLSSCKAVLSIKVVVLTLPYDLLYVLHQFLAGSTISNDCNVCVIGVYCPYF